MKNFATKEMMVKLNTINKIAVILSLGVCIYKTSGCDFLLFIAIFNLLIINNTNKQIQGTNNV